MLCHGSGTDSERGEALDGQAAASGQARNRSTQTGFCWSKTPVHKVKATRWCRIFPTSV
jgi:hypothetical protein